MKGSINLVAAAFALTAVSYGLARFAYGLFLPQISEDLALDVIAAGWIGGCAFAAYCLGILFTFIASGKLGPRAIALCAGAAATLGMTLVAFASSAWSMGIGIALAGLSTGLTSPPLATAVAKMFETQDRPKANATINSGTAAGIVFSGLAALAVVGAWRELYGVFALIGFGVTLWIFYAVPATDHGSDRQKLSVAILKRPGLLTLCISAFIAGASSTAIWTFGASILREDFAFNDSEIAWAWVALGIAGISGSLTGMLTTRFGSGWVHGSALLGMALAMIGLAATSYSAIIGFATMIIFGTAYIISTGAYLIQGIDLLPDRPDLGLGIPFLVIALGQSVGTPLFGATLDALGTVWALVAFAVLACLAVPIRPQLAATSLPCSPMNL
ncbi:MFS transporter [Pseudomonas sp. EL_65y_Pfl2_R95]|uniref:MFS transporter n=1 Tax=Pseudomonas sp. EL_65y_Pfl2_R95 TaxID=3088698 RepID=UPI0030DBAE5B